MKELMETWSEMSSAEKRTIAGELVAWMCLPITLLMLTVIGG